MTNGFLDSIATTRNQLGQRRSCRFLERRRIWSMERRDHAWKIRTARSAHRTIRAFMNIRRTYHRARRNSRLRWEIDGTRKLRILLPLFSPLPLLLRALLRRIDRTIYFRRVKTSDWWRHDANSTMWELIVTRSHRRGIIKTAYE